MLAVGMWTSSRNTATPVTTGYLFTGGRQRLLVDVPSPSPAQRPVPWLFPYHNLEVPTQPLSRCPLCHRRHKTLNDHFPAADTYTTFIIRRRTFSQSIGALPACPSSFVPTCPGPSALPTTYHPSFEVAEPAPGSRICRPPCRQLCREAARKVTAPGQCDP